MRSLGRDPVGVRVGGRYRLLERVGAGGMATVHRALDERLRREVAVKVIAEHLARDPLFVRRFRREAQHAHDRNVVHQDVTPGNILISRPGGAAKLADFGLASNAPEVPAGPVGHVTGTPGYVAPEILRGARPSPRSDLYSLGVVAHRLLAGPPRTRPSDPQRTRPVTTAVRQLPPLAEARPGLPRALTEAVQQALAQEPGARQGSVAEFRAQLVGHGRLQRGEDLAPRSIRRELPSAA